jgi:hypothetical protein
MRLIDADAFAATFHPIILVEALRGGGIIAGKKIEGDLFDLASRPHPRPPLAGRDHRFQGRRRRPPRPYGRAGDLGGDGQWRLAQAILSRLLAEITGNMDPHLW